MLVLLGGWFLGGTAPSFDKCVIVCELNGVMRCFHVFYLTALFPFWLLFYGFGKMI